MVEADLGVAVHDIFAEMEAYARTGHIPVLNPPRIAVIGSNGRERDKVIEAFLRWRPYGSGRIWDEKNRIYVMDVPQDFYAVEFHFLTADWPEDMNRLEIALFQGVWFYDYENIPKHIIRNTERGMALVQNGRLWGVPDPEPEPKPKPSAWDKLWEKMTITTL